MLEDIDHLHGVRGVVLRGEWLDRAMLDQLLREVHSAHDREVVDGR